MGKLCSCSEPILLSMSSPSCQPCCLLLASYPDNARVRLPVDAAVVIGKRKARHWNRASDQQDPHRHIAAWAADHWRIIQDRLQSESGDCPCADHTPAAAELHAEKGAVSPATWTLRGAILVLPGHVLTDPLAASWNFEAEAQRHYWHCPRDAYTVQIQAAYMLEAGSSGSVDFPQFRNAIITSSRRQSQHHDVTLKRLAPGRTCLEHVHCADPHLLLQRWVRVARKGQTDEEAAQAQRLLDLVAESHGGPGATGSKVSLPRCLAVTHSIAELIMKGQWQILVVLARWQRTQRSLFLEPWPPEDWIQTTRQP